MFKFNFGSNDGSNADNWDEPCKKISSFALIGFWLKSNDNLKCIRTCVSLRVDMRVKLLNLT